MAPPPPESGRDIDTDACADAGVGMETALNGNSRDRRTLGFERTELVRLTMQMLQDLGYHQALDALHRESGIWLEHPQAAQFRASILRGDYQCAIERMGELDRGLGERQRCAIHFLIYREQYFELLEGGKIKEALQVLRTLVTPNAADAKQVHALAGLIMHRGQDDLFDRSGWPGSGPSARQILLSSIQQLMPRGVLMPTRRLERLLSQAIKYQIEHCPAHLEEEGPSCDGNLAYYHRHSLLEDHQCDRSQLQFECAWQLAGHSDQVWHVAFSHCGRYMASASKDASVCLWDMADRMLLTRLAGHGAAVIFVCWSPDDKWLLTCSLDKKGRIWDFSQGKCVQVLALGGGVVAAQWTGDGKAVIVASEDGRLSICSLNGGLLAGCNMRVRDLALLPTGDSLLALDNDRTVHVISCNDLSSRRILLCESQPATSMSLSNDGKTLLLNTVSPAEVRIWSLAGERPRLLRCYNGHSRSRFIIRSCFGCESESLIISGSEDTSVYIWHRDRGHVLQVLKHHRACVNSVAWSNFEGGMIASASDDGSICIWRRPSRKNTE